jgi:MFS family permease
MPNRSFVFGRALGHRNYRLFMAGQSISLIGTWMQQVGLSWLVYELTKSAFMLGLVSFCSQIPSFFLAPIAGVLSDRWSRHRTLLVTQTIAMVQAITLAILIGTGQIQTWQIILLSLMFGFVNAFDLPTRQAFLIEMVPNRADLPNAIALNSSLVNSARLLGPFAAGLVIAMAGVMACFIFNAISFLAVLAALLAMRDLPARTPGVAGSLRRGLVEGFAYAFGFPPIRALLLLVSAVSILGVPLTLLLPVFAKDILHGGPELFGFLTGAAGFGALASGITLAMRKSVLGLGNLIVAASVTFGLAMLGFSFSEYIPLSLACLFVTGFCFMFTLASSNTLLQTIVEDDKRGRVMSMYAMAFMGTAPLGSLLGGTVADHLGAPVALRCCGSLCIVVGLTFARFLPGLRAQVIPIYQRIGVLPPVAVAMEQTAELNLPPE